jgi:hypothetical protein
MGGDVTVRSRPGAGAEFTLWLPAAPTSAAAPSNMDRLAARAPSGLAPIVTSDPAARKETLDAAAFAVLHALGVRLAADAETVAERYVASIRADDRFPGARDLPTVQLRNHATPVVGLLATQLMVIGETRGQAPELLGDGGQVQRLMDELHGAQRHRLGWTEADIERETPLLRVEVERALRAAVDIEAVAGVAPEAMADIDDSTISERAVAAAAQYAVDVVHHVLERGMRTAIRSLRFAKAADAR